MIYDFILFENTRITDNHYKDLENLALLLQKVGFSVAIADVFLEGTMCKNANIPHIKLKTRCPQGLELQYRQKNSLQALPHRYRMKRYLTKVILELLPQANNFYVGSLFTSMPTVCINAFPNNTNCFVWGLRSSVLQQRKRLSISYLYSLVLKYIIKKKDNIKLIVSNELIAEEFTELAIRKDRIVMRPERTISSLPVRDNTHNKSELHLLSIGSIRTKRRVEQCIKALAKLNDPSIFYIIAGKSNSDEREQQIMDVVSSAPNVERRNYRLTDDEYWDLIKWSDYLVICDDNYGGSASSGTMNEALLNNKPIIASDCRSFKHFVDKYHIGLTYEWENTDSLADAISFAKNQDFSVFENHLILYQKQFLESQVIEEFGKQIKEMIKFS